MTLGLLSIGFSCLTQLQLQQVLLLRILITLDANLVVICLEVTSYLAGLFLVKYMLIVETSLWLQYVVYPARDVQPLFEGSLFRRFLDNQCLASSDLVEIVLLCTNFNIMSLAGLLSFFFNGLISLLASSLAILGPLLFLLLDAEHIV